VVTSEQRDFYRGLGAAIRRERLDHGWTQRDMANELSISRTSLANIELGRQQVLLHHVVEIAARLGVSIAELLPAREDGRHEAVGRALDALPAEQQDWVRETLTTGRGHSGAAKGE
jgi:transcriptional regulator with XRE-family HTH domain